MCLADSGSKGVVVDCQEAVSSQAAVATGDGAEAGGARVGRGAGVRCARCATSARSRCLCAAPPVRPHFFLIVSFRFLNPFFATRRGASADKQQVKATRILPLVELA
jgi:hypothetical protein